MLSCCDLLIAEHRQAEDALSQLERLLATSDWPGAQCVYQALCQDLLRHFALEEQALFPLVSQYRSMMLMEVEHDDLLAKQAAFGQALKDAQTSGESRQETLMAAFQAFNGQLEAHIREEERGVFPLAESVLPPEEKQQALRLYHARLAEFTNNTPVLARPEPGFEVGQPAWPARPSKPIQFQTLFEREHQSVQQVLLQTGEQLARHWAGQHQYLLVLEGSARFEANGQTVDLTPGSQVTMDSRLWFSLQATSPLRLLLFKVWPHPHYTKAPPA